jgi:hypothetical protein
MSHLGQWHEKNDRYLTTAMTWLRLRLDKLAQSFPAERSTEAMRREEPPDRVRSSIRRREGSEPPDEDVMDVQIVQAAEDMQAAEKTDPPPALIILGQRVGLSRFEQQVLLLCTAMELDTRIASLCARAQAAPNRPYPTFALAMALFEDPAWDVASPERPLRRLRLIDINQPGAQPLTTSALKADERIVNYIKGLNHLDDRLSSMLSPIEVTDSSLPPSQQALADSINSHVREISGMRRLPVLQLTGLDSGSKQLIVSQVAAAFGLHPYRLPIDVLPQQLSELEAFARLWERETHLLPVALYLEARDAEPGPTADAALPKTTALKRLVARRSGLFFLETRDVWPGLGDTTIFDVATPTPAEQLAAWTKALGAAAGDSPAMLAGQFNLNAPTIARIAQTALADERPDNKALHERLWNSCLMTTRLHLDELAQRVDPKATWDDIVLPVEAAGLLRQIADQARLRMKVHEEWGFQRKTNRGLAINALFAGESGTGKTMAAEVIANELGLDLYRIDLSAVVNKYIGETEKNLRRLFDAAEDGGAILFFDEADALFGKRSEVKDSHDRYANIEINYLLQRMEAYKGLAILATNMKSALDQAFMRRLRFIVNFPFPGAAERKGIWQKVFPEETPVGKLDVDRLARLNLTGGAIRNIAMNAAFLAARSQSPQVTMPMILEAVRMEFRKLEKPINEAEFRAMEAVGAKP